LQKLFSFLSFPTYRVLLCQHQHGLQDLHHCVVHPVVGEGRDLLPVLSVGFADVARLLVVPVLGVCLRGGDGGREGGREGGRKEGEEFDGEKTSERDGE